MSDHIFDVNEGILVYLKHYPNKNGEEFVERFGEGEAWDQVRSILVETEKLPLDMSGKTLVEIGQDVREVMRERHPELTDSALKKLGNYFTYLVK